MLELAAVPFQRNAQGAFISGQDLRHFIFHFAKPSSPVLGWQNRAERRITEVIQLDVEGRASRNGDIDLLSLHPASDRATQPSTAIFRSGDMLFPVSV